MPSVRAPHIALAVVVAVCSLVLLVLPRPSARAQDAADAKSAAHPLGRACTTVSPPAVEAEGFRKKRYRLFLRGERPWHFAQDVVVARGRRATVEAKITYGDASKDLEEEPVRAWLDDCDGGRDLGESDTDDDGRVRFAVDTDGFADGGEHRVVYAVLGDASRVESRLWVVDEGTKAVVFDIDGTLTTGDDEAIEQAIDAGDIPDVAEGARDLVQAWADDGYLVVYLTGRPYWMLDLTRAWLRDEGFAHGVVRSTDRHRDMLPTSDGVGAFKQAYLESLQDAGLTLAAAYGNADTDRAAFAAVGIDEEAIFVRDAGSGWSDLPRP